MSTNIPRIGQPVVLRAPDGLSYASRVEDVDDNAVTAARPTNLRATIEYVEGLEFELVWTLPSGIHVLPVELAGERTEKQIRLWDLTITGDGWTEQRRDYVRVAVAGRITLTPLTALDSGDLGSDNPDSDNLDSDNLDPGFHNSGSNYAQPEPIAGELVDISEVATQCRVPVPADDDRISIGTRLQCEFILNGTEFRHYGDIVVARPATSARQAIVVVKFDISKQAEDALRKEVFAAQLANRR